jgi:predicted CoA-binding protein
MTDPSEILKRSKTVLLVDWPSPGVPRALLEAGFTVYGFSPHRYSAARLTPDRPDGVDAGSIFPPRDGERGYLVFRKLEGPPSSVDIVNTYRPPAELPGILSNHVLPLRARALWLQPPGASPEARRMAVEHGLAFVEGSDIAEVARVIVAVHSKEGPRRP